MEKQIRVAYSNMAMAHEQLDIQMKKLDNSRDLFETTKNKFDGARADLLQLLQSDNGLFTAEIGSVNAKFAAISAQYTVLASMGGLKEALFAVPAQEGATVIPASAAAHTEAEGAPEGMSAEDVIDIQLGKSALDKHDKDSP
jgi:hypothetical protein